MRPRPKKKMFHEFEIVEGERFVAEEDKALLKPHVLLSIVIV